jgi:hypothetical protein
MCSASLAGDLREREDLLFCSVCAFNTHKSANNRREMISLRLNELGVDEAQSRELL